MARLQEALGAIAQLAPTEGLGALRGTLHSELGEVFRAMGQHDRARQSFCAALRIAEELQDLRAQGVELSQLGTLALAEGNQQEALDRCRAALALLRRLHEPAAEAAAWHQLGVVFHQQQQWQEAERHYLEAARIGEQHGDLAAAQRSWNQLALLSQQVGQPAAAEAWYRRAIEAGQKSGNRMQLGSCLACLADLLQSQPGRLDEARNWPKPLLASTRLWTLPARNSGRRMASWQAFLPRRQLRRRTIGAAPGCKLRTRDYRQLQQYAPRFLGALTQLGVEASYARAVVMGRLARCFLHERAQRGRRWHACRRRLAPLRSLHLPRASERCKVRCIRSSGRYFGRWDSMTGRGSHSARR